MHPVARARALIAANRRMVGKLVVVTVVMFGFGYALVPIYRTICEALGVNVLARAEVQSGEAVGAVGNSQVDLSRTVTATSLPTMRRLSATRARAWERGDSDIG